MSFDKYIHAKFYGDSKLLCSLCGKDRTIDTFHEWVGFRCGEIIFNYGVAEAIRTGTIHDYGLYKEQIGDEIDADYDQVIVKLCNNCYDNYSVVKQQVPIMRCYFGVSRKLFFDRPIWDLDSER